MMESDPRSGLTTRLLDGLRVVEVGHRLSAPLVGMLLAEQGAEVVRVATGGDGCPDAVLDAVMARGKTELALDLDDPDHVATLHRLMAQADVVVENEGPGAMKRLGIDFDEIRAARNGELISCSLSAFPGSDPRASLPDYEAVVGMEGFLYDKPLGKPRFHDFPVCSVMAGLFATNAVVAALVARIKCGRGQHIETSLYDASLFAQVLQVLVKTGVPRGFLPLKMVGTPFMSPWLCQDDRYIYLHITLPAHNARILDMLEGEGYAENVRELRGILSAATMRDPSQVGSIPEAKKLRAAYGKIFLTKPAHAWEALLGDELCCIKVRTIEEWTEDSIRSGMTDVCMVDDPVFGKLATPGPAVTSAGRPPRVEARTLLHGGHAELLARWESTARPHAVGVAEEARAVPRHPLEGYRVLDLSRVIAGPCAARVLAELGAEVVSLQSPTSLDWALSFHLIFNAGKKSVTLDFSDDAGKEKLWAIIDEFQPHALVQNYRHLDIARAIGIDPDAVHEKLPSLVYTHLNAYGNAGGWQERPGFEQVVQAVSGIQVAYGDGGRPRLLPSPIIDIACGLSGALATVMGLYERERSGHGVFCNTHLTSMAVLFQVNRIADSQRSGCLRHARDAGTVVRHDRGEELLQGIVRMLDGPAVVAGPRAGVERWARSAGLVASIDPNDDLIARVSKRLWRKSAAHWQQTLVEAGVNDTVAILRWPSIRKLVRDIRRFDPRPAPAVRKRSFPGCPSELTFVRNPIRMSLTQLKDIAPPPIRGANTQEMLARIGERVAADAGVVGYPKNKPLILWMASFARWGYFAWRSGNI